MRQAIVFICDICEYADEDVNAITIHEADCIRRKADKEERLARRLTTGQLNIWQILAKCDNLPNLPVVINCETYPEYHGKYPSGTDSYRGYYDELAIDIGDKAMSLTEFRAEMTNSLRMTYTGYRGGDYSMKANTFVWLAEYGVSTGVLVTDLAVAPNEEVIHLTARLQE